MRVVVTGGSGFIGTNLVDWYATRSIEVLNLDTAEPRHSAQRCYWRQVDMLDLPALSGALADFQPTVIIHMAARTDLDERSSLAGYRVNTDGVANLNNAARNLSSLDRIVFTSSMLVCRNGYRPTDDEDYCPDTLYGKSKAIGERLVREASLPCPWVLVRPTSIWGPWFQVPYMTFFRMIAQNRYVHPGQSEHYKAVGFVGNTVHQITRLLEAPADRVGGRTFYLADYPPVTVRAWADMVQREIGARPIRTMPIPLLRGLALAGDMAMLAGWKQPPLTSFRLRNMLTPSGFDMDALRPIAGELPYATAEGVAITVRWLREQGTI